MGNPFKQVKGAIKEAYHSNTSSASPFTKPPAEMPTVVKAQHAVSPPHEASAAQINPLLSGKDENQAPLILPARQADNCQIVQPSQLMAGEQLTRPGSKQSTMKLNLPGPELPSHKAPKDDTHASFNDCSSGRLEAAQGTGYDPPPPPPVKAPLEPDEKREFEKKIMGLSDKGKCAPAIGLNEQSESFEVHSKPSPNEAQATDGTSSLTTMMHQEDNAVRKDTHSAGCIAMAVTISNFSATVDGRSLVGSSSATRLPAQVKETGASADDAGPPLMDQNGPLAEPSAMGTQVSAGCHVRKNYTEQTGGLAPSNVTTSASAGQCIAATATDTTSVTANSLIPDLGGRTPRSRYTSENPTTSDISVISANSVVTLSSNQYAAKQSADSSSPLPAAQPTNGPSVNVTEPINDVQIINGATESQQLGDGQKNVAQRYLKSTLPSREPTPSETSSKLRPNNSVKETGTTAAVVVADGESHEVTRTTGEPGFEKGSDFASPGRLSMSRSTDSEVHLTNTSSNKGSEVLRGDTPSPPGKNPTGQHKAFGLFAKPMLDHLQRVYDGLLPDSVRIGNTDAIASDHDRQQFTDYFIKFVQKEAASRPSDLNIRGFREFLKYMETSASATSSPKQQDMSLPLPNYYCNSSHNTYLTGNQLYSECSSDIYRTVLERGCRCLEIDVWDGEDSEETSRRSSISSSSSDDAHTTSSVSKRLHGVHTAELQITSGLKREMKSEARGVISSISGGLHKISSKARKILPEVASDGESSSSSSTDTSTAVDGQRQPSIAETERRQARNEPRVLHGHTLTREVSFREVCQVIRDSAFVKTDLPVIISLEVHAGHEQQMIMVEIMTEVWKDLLITVTQEVREKLANGEMSTLPSPADLRHKILIKVKSSPKADNGSTLKAPSSGAEGDVLELQPSLAASSESIGISLEGERSNKTAAKAKLIDELSALGIYTSAYSFKGLDRPEAHLPNHIFSLSESKLLEYFHKDRKALFEHNRNFMMRTYPSQFRIRSSNPDPSFSWRQGVQFAALNWQSIDLGMMINHAMFEGTDGWVLKPQSYRGDSWRHGLKATETNPKKALNLIIDVYAGQNIPLPSRDTKPKKFHPYVTCQLHVERPKDSAQAESQES
ncbi:hypothetical protein KEM54_000470, partial [Ascosphaera aggregata]